jgi:hypothetical protein
VEGSSKLPPQLSPEELKRPVVHKHVGPSKAPAPSERPKPVVKAPKTPIRPDLWGKALVAMGAVLVVIGLLVVPGWLFGGGQNPVAQAAEATMQHSGARVAMTGSFNGPGMSLNMQGNGAMNGETKQAEFSFAMTGSTAQGAGRFTVSEVIDGSDLYLHMPEGSSQVFGGSGWLLIRGEAFGDLFRQSGQGDSSPSDPQQQLQMLEDASTNVNELAPETIDGVSTKHYTATIDIQKMLDEQSGQLPDRLKEAAQAAFAATHPQETVDVWVDDQGLVRQARVNGLFANSISFSMTMTFTDYGAQPPINVPPASSVRDITPLLQQGEQYLQDS